MADKTATQAANALAVRNAVVSGFLETGQAQTAEDIAARLGWSKSKVYRVIQTEHGAVSGTVASDERRESYSKSYRNIQSGAHKVWAYEPSMQLLRKVIAALAPNQATVAAVLAETP